MKLYGMSMSRSFRAVWAAQEAELDFDYVAMEFGSEGENGTRSEQYLKLNPQGKVPTLTDGDLVIRESAAILNYLAAKAPEKNLMPADGTAARARYDEMCFFILAELEQPLWTKGKHKFALPEEYRVADVIDKTTPFEFAKAQATLKVLKGDNQYAIGDTFTMADVLLTQTLNWAEKFEYEVDQDLIDYKTAMGQRDAMKSAVARVTK
jgi:glutathione S-transferase